MFDERYLGISTGNFVVKLSGKIQVSDPCLILATEFTRKIEAARTYTPAAEHLKNLDRMKWTNIKEIERPLCTLIVKVRQLTNHPIFQKDRKLFERVVDDLVTRFVSLTGINFDSMSNYEQENLRHLVREAAGIKD